MHFKKSKLLSPVLLLFILLGSVKIGISQTDEANGKIVAFHPSLGTILNLSEKKQFNLFTEYTDSLFQSAQLVKYTNERYSVLIKTTNGQSFEKPITITELDAIYAKIEKIKPASAVTQEPLLDDYVQEKYSSKQKEVKKNRSETAYIIAEVTIQILFVFLEILAQGN